VTHIQLPELLKYFADVIYWRRKIAAVLQGQKCNKYDCSFSAFHTARAIKVKPRKQRKAINCPLSRAPCLADALHCTCILKVAGGCRGGGGGVKISLKANENIQEVININFFFIFFFFF
jgi:hypothetical protein